MNKLTVTINYNDFNVTFTEDGWFNATEVADKFGKRLDHWFENQETKDYIAAVARILNTPNSGDLIRAKKGRNGGTWLHPKLAVAFGRWISPDFAAWCDFQIDALLRGSHHHFDWKRSRHAASASFKVMSEALRIVREEQGKVAASYHYANEARLVNHAISGEFKNLDRNTLSDSELDLLAALEVRNSVLLGRGIPYADRKKMLDQYVIDCQKPVMAIDSPILVNQTGRAAFIGKGAHT